MQLFISTRRIVFLCKQIKEMFELKITARVELNVVTVIGIVSFCILILNLRRLFFMHQKNNIFMLSFVTGYLCNVCTLNGKPILWTSTAFLFSWLLDFGNFIMLIFLHCIIWLASHEIFDSKP
jgi:hypothetical protein